MVAFFITSLSDIAVIELGKVDEEYKGEGIKILYNTGVVLTTRGRTGIVNVDALNGTKLLEDVLISNDVFLCGYPTSLGIKESHQFDYEKPLLRKGIVANIYKNYGTIIIDCPVYYGNSGGPVIEVEQEGINFHYKIIGVVSQFIPFVEQWVNTKNKLVNTEVSNSGYSVIVSMDKVFELLKMD